jgi:hypothetical protein
LDLQFKLVDADGKLVTDRQRILGTIKTPTGDTIDLIIPDQWQPDANGIYSLPFRLTDHGLAANTTGRFELSLRGEDPKQPAPTQAIAVQRIWIQFDPGLEVTTPTIEPTVTNTPSPTPSLTPTLVPSPTPRTYDPVGGNDDEATLIDKALNILPFVVGGVLLVYLLARLLIKAPQGFIAITKDGLQRGPISIRKKASRKIWGWWKLTVGPKGNIRISLPSTSGPGGAMGGMYQQPADTPEVQVPGLGHHEAAAERQVPTSKKKSKKKRKRVFGYITRDGERTKFRYESELGRGAGSLKEDQVDTVNLGTVQLKMSLNRDLIQGK